MTGSIFRLKDLIEHTGLSRSAIYDRMDPKSPRYAPDFPKSFSLGGKAIGWSKDEVNAWLLKCKDALTKPKQKTSIASTRLDRKPSTPIPTSPPVMAKRASGGVNLAQTIVEGGKINDQLLSYLQLETWTPAMCAMLTAGIAPTLECLEIPDEGVGLDGKKLQGGNARFNAARRFLRDWQDWTEEQDMRQETIKPLEYLCWALDSDLDTDWLSLMQILAGYVDESKVDLTAARFALLTGP